MIDVIVIGLGAMGSAATHYLTKRGKRVLGLEQYISPHSRGSSHGNSRIIRQAYYEDPAYVPLVLRSYELWRQLEADTRSNLLHITGAIMIGKPDGDIVSGSIRSALHHGLPHEVLTAAEIRRRFPPFTPQQDDIALFESLGGYLLPEESIRQQLNSASRAGAEIHFEEPVHSWSVRSSDGRVTVRTERSVYEADHLVVCAGPWAPEYLGELALPLVVTRQVFLWIHPTGGVEPFRPERFPVFMWERDGDFHLYGFPALDSENGRVKTAFHGSHQSGTPATIDRSISPEDTARVQEKLASRIPALNGPVSEAATCLYTMTPDGHFVLGLHPFYPSVSIAAGFSGHGFKFATVIGEILSDLAIDGKTRHDIEFLSPLRFAQN